MNDKNYKLFYVTFGLVRSYRFGYVFLTEISILHKVHSIRLHWREQREASVSSNIIFNHNSLVAVFPCNKVIIVTKIILN